MATLTIRNLGHLPHCSAPLRGWAQIRNENKRGHVRPALRQPNEHDQDQRSMRGSAKIVNTTKAAAPAYVQTRYMRLAPRLSEGHEATRSAKA